MPAVEHLYVKFGQRVRAVRLQRNMAQAELARRMRMSRASIALIEAGKQRSSLHQLEKFARILCVSKDQLLP